ncbi:MAG: uroporphyrinogen-III synthase [Pseudomonadales bacterium]
MRFTPIMASNSNNWLQGKRILVTRPERQAESLVAAIQAQGGEAIRCPVLAITPNIITQSGKQKIINLDQYDDLVFISTNAVRFGFELIADYWPQLPAHLRFFAVGKSTAACLEAESVRVSVPATGFNSEALLQLPELQQLSHRRVLIFKGEGGRELLAQSFTERGAQVESLELYLREALSYSAEQLQTLFDGGLPDALIATSVDVLTALDALLKSCLVSRFELPLVVASERIASAAKGLGYQQIITSSGAADESIVKALNVIG